MLSKSRFAYEPAQDGYRCPEGQVLPYATTDRSGYKHYTLRSCPLQGLPAFGLVHPNAKATRTITRHVWPEARERADAHRLTPWGKASTSGARRPSNAPLPMPNSFMAIAMPGSEVCGAFRCQCLLAAAAQNIKKIAMALTKTPQPRPA